MGDESDEKSKEELSFNTKLGIGLLVVFVIVVVAVVIWKLAFTNNGVVYMTLDTTPEVLGPGMTSSGNMNMTVSSIKQKIS
jgi:hypothetical protein